MVTINEVAKLAGVSKATVSRVINNTVKVSPEKHKQVTKVMRQLGFKPNTLAQNLANKRSNAIGVLVGDVSSPYFGLMLKGIETEIEIAKMQLMVADGHNDSIRGKKAIEFLIERRCDAIIICQEMVSKYDLHNWTEQGQQFVIIGQDCPVLKNHSVYLDNQEGGYLATQHLIENGHSRVAHLTGPRDYQDNCYRLQGYQNALKKNNIEYDEMLIVEGDCSEKGGYEKTRQLLQQRIPFTALFAGNDQMAIGAMAAIHDAQLKIPDDISVVGFDDILFARFVYPTLTTIHQPLAEMGKAAVQIAIGSLSDQVDSSIQRQYQPQLIQRKSVAQLSEKW